MKKAILMVALLTGLSVTGLAQEGKKGMNNKNKQERRDMSVDEKAKQSANWAGKKLGLSDEQKTKWESAAKERIGSNTTIREKLRGSTTPEERKLLHSEAKVNNDRFNVAVAGFLTPEQKAKFDKLKQDKAETHKKKMKGKKQEDEKELAPDVED